MRPRARLHHGVGSAAATGVLAPARRNCSLSGPLAGGAAPPGRRAAGDRRRRGRVLGPGLDQAPDLLAALHLVVRGAPARRPDGLIGIWCRTASSRANWSSRWTHDPVSTGRRRRPRSPPDCRRAAATTPTAWPRRGSRGPCRRFGASTRRLELAGRLHDYCRELSDQESCGGRAIRRPGERGGSALAERRSCTDRSPPRSSPSWDWMPR